VREIAQEYGKRRALERRPGGCFFRLRRVPVAAV